MEDYYDSRNFYGIIASRIGKNGHNASFHEMLANHKEAYVKRRNELYVVDPDKEEKEHDHVTEECEKNLR